MNCRLVGFSFSRSVIDLYINILPHSQIGCVLASVFVYVSISLSLILYSFSYPSTFSFVILPPVFICPLLFTLFFCISVSAFASLFKSFISNLSVFILKYKQYHVIIDFENERNFVLLPIFFSV